MTDLPGAFLRRLWILGNRYSFPKLITFLYSKKKKNFSSFSEITPFLLKGALMQIGKSSSSNEKNMWKTSH